MVTQPISPTWQRMVYWRDRTVIAYWVQGTSPFSHPQAPVLPYIYVLVAFKRANIEMINWFKRRERLCIYGVIKMENIPGTETVTMYCVRCRAKKEINISNLEERTLAVKGILREFWVSRCPECDTAMWRVRGVKRA